MCYTVYAISELFGTACIIQIGFTFLVPAHPGSPGKRAVKWYVCIVCGAGCMHLSGVRLSV